MIVLCVFKGLEQSFLERATARNLRLNYKFLDRIRVFTVENKLSQQTLLSKGVLIFFVDAANNIGIEYLIRSHLFDHSYEI